ncbi:MAG: hypothetical protein ABJP45_18675 [Cyclobacteriaceae bacterium]
MKKHILLLLLAVPFLSSAGGGWPKKKGTGYYKLTEWWVVADKHYTSNGGTDSNVTTGIFNTSFYAEYGITDKLTGILYFPFFSRTFQNDVVSATTGLVTTEGQALNSIGDTDVGVKYGISKPGSFFAFAGSVILGIPLGNNAGGRDGSLQTGDGEFNQMIQFDLSKSASFGKISAYANVYAGLNNRTNDFSDEFRFGGEIGASFLKNKLWLIYRINVLESFQNGLTSADGSSGTTIFANNTEFASYSYEGAFYITDKLGISASYASVFSGKIIFANPAYSVGVFLDLK